MDREKLAKALELKEGIDDCTFVRSPKQRHISNLSQYFIGIFNGKTTNIFFILSALLG